MSPIVWWTATSKHNAQIPRFILFILQLRRQSIFKILGLICDKQNKNWFSFCLSWGHIWGAFHSTKHSKYSQQGQCCSTDLDLLNYVSFVSHGRTRQSDSFNLRTPLCKKSTFQASYLNRIVKPCNYVCKLAPPNSFCSPNAFQLFVRKLMGTQFSRVYDLNYPCTWTLVSLEISGNFPMERAFGNTDLSSIGFGTDR